MPFLPPNQQCQSTAGSITHTRTRLTALCQGLPRWAGTRKVKPIWILLKQETVSGSVISWAICKSAHRSRQITMPAPHHSIFYRPDALPAAQPTVSKHWRQYKCSIFTRWDFLLQEAWSDFTCGQVSAVWVVSRGCHTSRSNRVVAALHCVPCCERRCGSVQIHEAADEPQVPSQRLRYMGH